MREKEYHLNHKMTLNMASEAAAAVDAQGKVVNRRQVQEGSGVNVFAHFQHTSAITESVLLLLEL